MTRHLIRAIAAIAFLGALSFSLAPSAGEINLAAGVALKGHDPVAYFTDGKPVRGRDDLRVERGGAAYLFASTEHRDAFSADPERYLPRYGGYCAFGVSRGYKADIDPAAFTIAGGKLYLNYNEAVRKEWLQDRDRLIAVADGRWPEVRETKKFIR